tara:strand:- start:56 stop:622 length:567 start_codon:yes stop_codon:yes gene_type:complete
MNINSKINKYFKNIELYFRFIYGLTFAYLLYKITNNYYSLRNSLLTNKINNNMKICMLIIIGIIYKYIDTYLATLLFILFLIQIRYANKEYFINGSKEKYKNHKKIVMPELKNVIVSNDLNTNQLNTTVNKMYNKYFNKEELVNNLKELSNNIKNNQGSLPYQNNNKPINYNIYELKKLQSDDRIGID